MIAKNLRAGKYSDGIINYVFEGRELEHRDKQAHVLKASGDLLLPYSAQDREGISELKRDFNSRTSEYLKINPDNKNALIGHQLLSFTREDEKKLGPEGIKKVLDEYIDLANLEKTRYIAVGHKDTSNYHIHIVYHKVGQDMKKENEWKLNNITIERGVALALKNKLSLVKDQDKVALTRGVLEIRVKDKDIHQLRDSDQCIKSARNMLHLTKLLEADGRRSEYLNDGRIRIDKSIHRPEDLNAVFYYNRNMNKVDERNKFKEEKAAKSDLKSLKSDIHDIILKPFQPEPGFERVSSSNSIPGNGIRASGIVTIKSEEGKPMKRKRRGKQYLLKAKKSKISKEKGLNL